MSPNPLRATFRTSVDYQRGLFCFFIISNAMKMTAFRRGTIWRLLMMQSGPENPAEYQQVSGR